jgi:glycyl-tRNA synthetase beta chain
MNQTLLIELFTEELPPKALPKLAAAFAQTVVAELGARHLLTGEPVYETFASPRRLGVAVKQVLAQAPDREVEEKIMSVAVAFDAEGKPAMPLLKKLESKGLDASAVGLLERRPDGKAEALFLKQRVQGDALAKVIDAVLAETIKRLPAPKLMRWGAREVQFVRPAHGLVVLHGADVVPAQVLGLNSGRSTTGHRFLSAGKVEIGHADHYADTLKEQGKVIAGFEARRAAIVAELNAKAAAHGATIAGGDALVDEVSGLVEWPVVLEGGFEEDFLKVPQECLILTMQQNQKYFPLLNAQGKLTNRYLIVSNLASKDPGQIVHGNGRVLRARLSDAKFFYEQDQKHRLDSRLQRMAAVVYHNKIGSQLERITRLETVAAQIGEQLGVDAALAARAAHLAKADLVSDMVGEFPELQGIMGTYYARLDGEHEAVADAIEGHYHPRFAGDSLPVGPIAQAVALADKLETLVGIWGIGLIPTGDKDPYALRRAALGVMRILVEGGLTLDLRALLACTAEAFPAGVVAAGTAEGVFGFMIDRLKNLLAADYPAADIEAVLADAPGRFDEVARKLAAVAEFKALPEAAALAAANKRIRNILKKNLAEGQALPAIAEALLQEAAERELRAALRAVQVPVETAFAAHDYTAALKQLASLRAPVDAFFDGVMVMADDMAVRNNRLSLLAELSALMNRVADISLLAE